MVGDNLLPGDSACCLHGVNAIEGPKQVQQGMSLHTQAIKWSYNQSSLLPHRLTLYSTQLSYTAIRNPSIKDLGAQLCGFSSAKS